MSIANEFLKECQMVAKMVCDYETTDTNILADKYCEAIDTNNEFDLNCYLSALICKFWYVIPNLVERCKNIKMEREDFVNWLVEGINYACKYRAWQNPDKHTNAHACITQSVNTIRLQHYYQMNLDLHKASYSNISIDSMKSGAYNNTDEWLEYNFFDDHFTVAADHKDDLVGIVVGEYLKNNKVIEAVILDNIANRDSIKYDSITTRTTDKETGEEIKTTEKTKEFSAFKVVKALNSLPEDYIDTFIKRYGGIRAAVENAVEAIKSAANQKKYKYLDKTLEDFRNNKFVLELFS